MFTVEKNIVTDTFIKNLSKSQISIDSIDKNYLSNFHKERLIKLNVSNVKEEKIEEGIGKVIGEIKRTNRVDFQFKKE